MSEHGSDQLPPLFFRPPLSSCAFAHPSPPSYLHRTNSVRVACHWHRSAIYPDRLTFRFNPPPGEALLFVVAVAPAPGAADCQGRGAASVAAGHPSGSAAWLEALLRERVPPEVFGDSFRAFVARLAWRAPPSPLAVRAHAGCYLLSSLHAGWRAPAPGSPLGVGGRGGQTRICCWRVPAGSLEAALARFAPP